MTMRWVVVAGLVLVVAGAAVWVAVRQRPPAARPQPGPISVAPRVRPPVDAGVPARAVVPAATTGNAVSGVDPTYELDKIREKFVNELVESTRSATRLAESEAAWREWKRQGRTMWGSEKWMKEPAYYKALQTPTLMEECLARPSIGFEMGLYDDHRLSFTRLRIMHNGYAELLGRDDLWQGVLHAYDHLGRQLTPDKDLQSVVRTSFDLYGLQAFYDLPEFRKQLKGREKLFLRANVEALKRYRAFIDSFDSQKLGTRTPFFREPVVLAQSALALTEQVDPARYRAIEPELRAVKWPKQQDLRDVRAFLDQTISGIGDAAAGE